MLQLLVGKPIKLLLCVNEYVFAGKILMVECSSKVVQTLHLLAFCLTINGLKWSKGKCNLIRLFMFSIRVKNILMSVYFFCCGILKMQRFFNANWIFHNFVFGQTAFEYCRITQVKKLKCLKSGFTTHRRPLNSWRERNMQFDLKAFMV